MFVNDTALASTGNRADRRPVSGYGLTRFPDADH